ncbi:MAG TPA: AI-2E family transporter [Nitrospiraceae bacterium]|nr:AI-2E family transporter [Nitrospiraceae bacterium]
MKPSENTSQDREVDITTRGRLTNGPLDIRSLALTGLFVMACFYTLYWGRGIFLPITLALLLSFLLAPLIRALRKLAMPEPVGAALVLLTLLAVVGYGAYRLSEPAAQWMAEAPRAFRQVEYKLRALKKPVEEVSRATEQLGKIANIGEPKKLREVELKRPSWSEALVGVTGEFIGGLAATVILLYFFLASGDLFLQKLVKVLPRLEDKKRAVEIVREIERHTSTYLLTVSAINACVGVVIGLAMFLLGMPNPVLWGVMAAFLTFIPYLGPLVGVGVITVVAALTFDELGWILLVGGTYWGIAALEGTFISPMVVGHRLTLNPVVLLFGLFLWGWIWGIGGALLAVPLMATFKIFCDHIEPLAPIGEFLGQ